MLKRGREAEGYNVGKGKGKKVYWDRKEKEESKEKVSKRGGKEGEKNVGKSKGRGQI